jgi:hypothetical protein
MAVWGEDDAVDRAKCKAQGVHYCEPGNPFPKGGKGRAYHPQAKEVDDSQEGGWPSGDTVRYKCPVCGTGWRSELPQWLPDSRSNWAQFRCALCLRLEDGLLGTLDRQGWDWFSGGSATRTAICPECTKNRRAERDRLYREVTGLDPKTT